MKKNMFVVAALFSLVIGTTLAFKARDTSSIVYTPGPDGQCTVELPQRTTVENPPNPTLTLPSATTEEGGECTTLEVWFTN